MAIAHVEGVMSPEDHQRIKEARYILRSAEPAYAMFLFLINFKRGDPRNMKQIARMKVEPDRSLTIFLNFEVFNRLSLVARAEVLKHCVLHIPYGHVSSRMEALKEAWGPQIASLAGDLVINQLINPGILAIEGVVIATPDLFGLPEELTTEQYCQSLHDLASGEQPKPDPKKVAGKKSPSDNYSVQSWGCPNMDQEANEEAIKSITDDNGLVELSQEDVDSGSTTNEALDATMASMISQVESALEASDESLKSQGFMKGEALQFIESIKREARIGWRTVMRRKVGKHRTLKRKVHPRRPSRRGQQYWGRISQRKVCVLAVVDTSGSMGERELRCIESEMKMLHSQGVRLFITHVDAGVAKPPEEYNGRKSLNEWAGRGGTDFCPGFQAALEMNPAPDFLVYVTDGFGTAPESQPLDTLWLLTSEGMEVDEFKSQVCEWGDCMVLDVDD